MKTLTTLALILFLPASYTALAQDDKAAARAARRAAAKAAETTPAAKTPSFAAVPAKTGLRLSSLFGDHMILQQYM